MELIYRYAWVLGALGAALAVATGSLAWLYGGLDSTSRMLGVAASLLIAAWAALDRDTLSEGAQSRAAKQSAMSLLLLAVAAACGVYAVKIAMDHDKRWDWTDAGRFTLAPESIEVAQRIAEPVLVKAFFLGGSPGERQFKELVEGYTLHSDLLEVQLIDPLSNPMEAQKHLVVTETGTVVIVANGREQRLEARFDEDALTRALLRLESDEDRVLCWSVGHGEADPDDDTTVEGFGAAVVRLEGRSYTVKKARVASEGIDPACEALLVIRPTVDWAPNAREALAGWLAGGGRALLMLEPTSVPELAADLERYGLTLIEDLVLEDSPAHRQFGQDPSAIILYEENFTEHPITAPLKGSVVLSYARSVIPDPRADGLEARALLRSSSDAWTELDLDDPAELGPDEDERHGDVPLGAAVIIRDPAVVEVDLEGDSEPSEGEQVPSMPSLIPSGWAPEAGGRLVVLGDSFPGSNSGVYTGNNGDLVFNSIAWLLEEDEQLTERPSEATDQLLQLSIVEEGFVGLLSIVLVPGLTALLALLTLLRRRRL